MHPGKQIPGKQTGYYKSPEAKPGSGTSMAGMGVSLGAGSRAGGVWGQATCIVSAPVGFCFALSEILDEF